MVRPTPSYMKHKGQITQRATLLAESKWNCNHGSGSIGTSTQYSRKGLAMSL